MCPHRPRKPAVVGSEQGGRHRGRAGAGPRGGRLSAQGSSATSAGGAMVLLSRGSGRCRAVASGGSPRFASSGCLVRLGTVGPVLRPHPWHLTPPPPPTAHVQWGLAPTVRFAGTFFTPPFASSPEGRGSGFVYEELMPKGGGGGPGWLPWSLVGGCLKTPLTPPPSYKRSLGGGCKCTFFCIFFAIFLAFFSFFIAFFLHFFASVLPSVSFCCGTPWATLCHMHHFDRGAGDANAFICLFPIAFCAFSTHPPPPPRPLPLLCEGMCR